MREDVDAYGTVKIVFFPLLSHHQKKTSTLGEAVFVHVPHEFVRSSRSSNSTSASSSGLRRIEVQRRFAVLESEVLQPVRIANPPQLEKI